MQFSWRGLAVCLAMLALVGLNQPGRADVQGLPFINWYPPQVYEAGTQNWAITQGLDGLMYFGNDSRVLVFDGSRWEQIPILPGLAVRSLATADDGRILVGTQGDFGYLHRTSDGSHHYRSLLDRLPTSAPDFTDVWQVLVNGPTWYFSSPQALFILDAERAAIIAHGEQRAAGSFLVGGQIYTELADGLARLGPEYYETLPGAEPGLGIFALLPAADGRFLVGTRADGLHLLDPAEGSLAAVADEAGEWLAEHHIYHGTVLADGRHAFATLRGGLLILDLASEAFEIIDRARGLPDVRVRHIYNDSDGGLWLALDSGLARLEPQSVISRWDERSGLDGPALSLLRFNGRLYAGTTLGLFMLAEDGFHVVPGIDSEVWDLHEQTFPDGSRRLLAATSYGIHELVENEARLLSEPYLSTSLASVSGQPGRLWVGTYDLGLGYIELAEEVQRTRFTDIRTPVRQLTVDGQDMLWLSSWMDGVFHIDPLSAATLWQFPSADSGLETTGLSVLMNERFQLISSRDQIWQWLGNEATVSRDDLRPMLTEPRSGSERLVESEPGLVWSIATDGVTQRIRLAWPEQPDRPHPVDALLQRLPDVEFYTIYPDGQNRVWIAGSDALYRVDLGRQVATNSRFRVLWRAIRAGKRSLAVGPLASAPRLSTDEDFPLRFEFAAPAYDWPAGTQFRHRLTPSQADWSEWAPGAAREFNHLPHGDYRFQVQARNIYGQIDSVRDFGFKVPPPWYLAPWTLWLGGIMLLAMIPALLWLGGRRHAHRNARLEALVSQRTAELSEQQRMLKHERDRLDYLSHHDELTGLANRRRGQQRLAEALDQAATQAGYLSVALLDIDHFKQINDSHGHEIGDRVLVEIAGLLKTRCRPEDLVARWGGEEFLLLFPFTSLPDAAAVCHRIRDLINQHPWNQIAENLSVSASIGLTAARGEQLAAGLLSRADELLYRAKQSGRDRVEVERETW